MSKFIKSEFSTGEYATYNGKFVARFKRGNRGSFLTFLCKNFTVEEYFSHLDAGMAPLTILEYKGYLLPHVKKHLKEIGYEVSVEGFKQYIQSQVDKHYLKV